MQEKPVTHHRTPQRMTARHRLGMAAGWLAALLLCSLPASAQVNRCTAADGRIVYTDGQCPAGMQAVQIEAPRSPEEIEADQERALRAFEREQQRQQARQQTLRLQAETEALQAQAEAARAAAGQQRSAGPSPAACRAARQQLERATLDHGRYDREGLQRLHAAQAQVERACPDAAPTGNAAAPTPLVLPPWAFPPAGHGLPPGSGWGLLLPVPPPVIPAIDVQLLPPYGQRPPPIYIPIEPPPARPLPAPPHGRWPPDDAWQPRRPSAPERGISTVPRQRPPALQPQGHEFMQAR
ncbi:DUF4124 domain-containing protein [Vandammella animalimorsus]|uniref:DUF4124 domain-containing protein n=1 Tax=Vandammella animalimorsus TaxID=2029117 RepID=A0A3M6R8L2_9BURK|nr:DUF4124 domain-containing protein [Vandammella animalimorsus]